jgi:hypothetical protein
MGSICFTAQVSDASDPELTQMLANDPNFLLELLKHECVAEARRLIKLDSSCIRDTEIPYICQYKSSYYYATDNSRQFDGILVELVTAKGRTLTDPEYDALYKLMEDYRYRKTLGVQIIGILLTYDTKYNDKNLALAISYEVPNVIALIKSGKFNLACSDTEGNTLLMRTIMNLNSQGSAEYAYAVAAELLTHPECDVNQRNFEGQTALMLSVSQYYSYTALTKALMQLGAETLLHKDKKGKNVLCHAIIRGHPEICHALIDTGKFSPYEMDNERKSLLTYACEYTRYDVIARLSDNNQTLLRKVVQNVEDEKRRQEEDARRRRQEEEEERIRQT